MSSTGIGFDSSLRAGSFSGKKNSFNPWKSDFHSGSNVSPSRRRRAGSSLILGLTLADGIILPIQLSWWAVELAILLATLFSYTEWRSFTNSCLRSRNFLPDLQSLVRRLLYRIARSHGKRIKHEIA